MRISGFWLTLLMVLGMVASLVGVVGWVVGYFYADPSQAAAHPVMYPLARIAVIVGPIMLIGGAALFIGSIYEFNKQEKIVPPPEEAPISPQVYRPRSHRKRQKEEGAEEEDEIPTETIEP